MGKKDKDPEKDSQTKRRDIADGLEAARPAGQTAEHSIVPEIPSKEEEIQPPRQTPSSLTKHESPIAQQLLRNPMIRNAKFGKEPMALDEKVPIMVLDTSALMENPKLLETATAKPTCFVVPDLVIEELDGLKLEHTKRRAAQKAIKSIFKILSKHPTPSEKVYHYQNNFIIFDNFLSEAIQDYIINTMNWVLEKNDTKVVALAKQYKEYYPGNQVSVVSMDFNLLSKAIRLQLNAVEYNIQQEEIIIDEDDGLSPNRLELTDEHWKLLFTEKKLSLDIFPNDSIPPANEVFICKNPDQDNEFLLVNPKRTHLVRLKDKYEYTMRTYGKDLKIKALNHGQQLALCQLLDPEIQLVIIHGEAGTGKTLLALAAATVQIQKEVATPIPKISISHKKSRKQNAAGHDYHEMPGNTAITGYQAMLVCRSPVPAGKEVGYLKGDLSDKMKHWLMAIQDNAKFLFPAKSWDMVKDEYSIDYGSLEHFRGRTIKQTFIIVDEAQNLKKEEDKTIITRVEQSSKIVLIGDISQIDPEYLNVYNNGLSILTQKIMETRTSANPEDCPPSTAIIKLTECERGGLAKWGAKFL